MTHLLIVLYKMKHFDENSLWMFAALTHWKNLNSIASFCLLCDSYFKRGILLGKLNISLEIADTSWFAAKNLLLTLTNTIEINLEQDLLLIDPCISVHISHEIRRDVHLKIYKIDVCMYLWKRELVRYVGIWKLNLGQILCTAVDINFAFCCLF